MHIPIKVALLGTAGHYALNLERQLGSGDAGVAAAIEQIPQDNTELVLDLTAKEQSFVFEQIPEPPVASVLRGFSAPIQLEQELAVDQLQRLILSDDDGFTRFNAVQQWVTDIVAESINGQRPPLSNSDYIDVVSELLASVLTDQRQDPALIAMLISLPEPAYILEQLKPADPLAIYESLTSIKQSVVSVLGTLFWRKLAQIDQTLITLESASQMLSGEAIALRSLKQSILAMLSTSKADEEQIKLQQYAVELYARAPNMTERLMALKVLIRLETQNAQLSAQAKLADFYQRFRHESLVVNMWLQLQACAESEQTLTKVRALMEHEAFDIRNPNKLRALLGGFCSQNPLAFHAKDGSGYEFLADQIIALNQLNPQLASRLVTPLTHWAKLDQLHSRLMKAALQRISQQDNLSKDVFEVVGKSLAAGA